MKPKGLKEIAKAANVSVSLVSKVLNDRLGNSRVTPRTVKAIRAAARAMGYQKNHAASGLASGRQNVIGGFLHHWGVASSGIAEQLVRGMAAEAASRGRRLMLRFFQSTDEFQRFLPEITSALVDGLIVAGVRDRGLGEELAAIESRGLPVVTVHEKFGEGEAGGVLPNVFVDQVQVGDLATEHLIAQGCRRIAQIKMTEPRAEGYAQALRRHRMRVDRSLIFQASTFNSAGGVVAARHFLEHGIEFDGLVAQSDELALGAINVLAATGRRVPEDVKVVGVDNSPYCDLLSTPLSSISTETFAQGQCATDLLICRIEGRPVSSMRIEPILHRRKSSSAPGQGDGGASSDRVSAAGLNHVSTRS